MIRPLRRRALPRTLAPVVLTALAVAAAGLAPAPGAAQEPTDKDEEARYHFNLGQVAYNSGRFVDAAEEFEEAYRLSNRSALLYNIFLARRDAGQLGLAIQALERFLELEPDSPDAPAIRRRLENMRRIYEEQGGEPTTEPPPPGPTEEPPPAEEPPPEEPVVDDGGDQDGGGGGVSIPGVVLVGVGGAMVIGGVVTGVLALQSESDLEDACGNGPCPPGFEDDIDQGRRRAVLTDVLIPLGVVTAGVGVVLMVLGVGAGGDDGDETGSRGPAVDVACGRSGCAGAVTVRF